MTKSRIYFIFLFFLVLWAGMILRGGYLQLVEDSRLEELRKKQFATLLTLRSRRGALYDREGRELAVSVTSYSLFVDPKIIENPLDVARKLSQFLHLNHEQLRKVLRHKQRRFVWVKRFLNKEQKEKILSWEVRGLGFVEEPKRIYPNNSLAAANLGFVGADGQGLEGLEKQYDSFLKGHEMRVHISRDARGRPLIEGGNFYSQVADGFSIQLTLDNQIQFILEQELAATVEKFGADSAVGVVLDARNSDILAMGQYPGFNANHALRFPSSVRRNHAIVDSFEPGSTMKTIVMAGALQTGVAQPNTSIDCEGGHLEVDHRIIREAEANHHFGLLTVSEILALSSNVGTAKLAFSLGEKQLRETLNDFGFGKPTGVDFVGESSGIIQGGKWNKHLLANVSFGQGVTTTPLQMAAAYAAIANGGVWRQPGWVKRIFSEDRSQSQLGDLSDQQVPKRVERRVLSSENAATLTLMLTQATSHTGTGTKAQIKGFPVAGKTGTAQKVDLKRGGYMPHSYISSFAGFVPAQEPRFVIYVAVDNPRVQYYGAQVAAPVFSRLAAFAVRRWGLSPVLLTEEDLLKKPSQTQPDLEDQQKLALTGVLDSKKWEDQGRVPDLRGLTLREVVKVLRGTDFKFRLRGRGVVKSMRPLPGTKLSPHQEIQIQLKPLEAGVSVKK